MPWSDKRRDCASMILHNNKDRTSFVDLKSDSALLRTYTCKYGSLKVLHFCLGRNYGLRVCGLVFTSLEARLVFC